MDYYDVSIQCTMVSLGGNPKAEWAKREDVEAVLAERDALRRKLNAVKLLTSSQHVYDECDRLERDDDAERIDDYIGIVKWMCGRLHEIRAIVEASTGRVGSIEKEG